MTLVIALIILLTLIIIEWKVCKNLKIKTFYIALLSATINWLIVNFVEILTWDHRCAIFFSIERKTCSYSEYLFGGFLGSLPFIVESLVIIAITILTIYILNYFKNGRAIPNPRIILKKYKFSFLGLLIGIIIYTGFSYFTSSSFIDSDHMCEKDNTPCNIAEEIFIAKLLSPLANYMRDPLKNNLIILIPFIAGILIDNKNKLGTLR